MERHASKLTQDDVMWAWNSGLNVASAWFYEWPGVAWAKWIPELRDHPLALKKVEDILDDFIAAVEGASAVAEDPGPANPDLPAAIEDPLDDDEPLHWYRDHEDDGEALLYAGNDLVERFAPPSRQQNVLPQQTTPAHQGQQQLPTNQGSASKYGPSIPLMVRIYR